MSPAGAILTPGDLRRALGLAERTFYDHQQAGDFKRFELAAPIGRYRYSRALVEAFLAGGGLGTTQQAGA